jgi:hypothetical protein
MYVAMENQKCIYLIYLNLTLVEVSQMNYDGVMVCESDIDDVLNEWGLGHLRTAVGADIVPKMDVEAVWN